MQYPVVCVLSGPEKTRAKAELALEKARLTIIPPKEWPIQRESYAAEHWPHMTQLVSGQEPDEEHGFVAVLAESEAAFHAAYGVVAKSKWVLRSHYELPDRPKPDPMSELFDKLVGRLDSQEKLIGSLGREVARLGGHPPISGAGFETGAGEFMQTGSYSAAQLRRSVFAWAARTGANVPGTIAGGLLSASDMQLSAGSGLSVNTSVGECLIGGTEATSQGGYHGFLSSTNATTLATANATNPRIDLICATAADSSYTIPSGGTSGFVMIQTQTGTPTAGATLSNLSGAPSLPASSLLLGYVLVPASATSLTGADIANTASLASVNPAMLGTWTAYTPVISAGSGSITSYTATASYLRVSSQLMAIRLGILFSNIGSASGALNVSTPVGYSASGEGLAVAREISSTGYLAAVGIGQGATTIAMYGTDITNLHSVWANGYDWAFLLSFPI